MQTKPRVILKEEYILNEDYHQDYESKNDWKKFTILNHRYTSKSGIKLLLDTHLKLDYTDLKAFYAENNESIK